MKRKINKIFVSILFLGIILTLASCDFHFEKLFESDNTKEKADDNKNIDDGSNNKTTDDNDSNKTEDKDNTDDKTSDKDDTEEETNNPITDKINEIIGALEEEIVVTTPTDNEKTNEEELKIKDYLLDYTHDYGYINLANDTNGADMQKIYREAYNLAKDVLTSASDYETQEVNVTVTNSDGTKSVVKENYVLLPALKFNNSGYSSSMNSNIAASAVMEMIYDNPLFYFLNSGYLSSSDSVQLSIIAEYKTAEARTIMNNKILSMFDDINNKYSLSTLSDSSKYESINKYIMDKIEYAYESDNKTPSDAYWAHNIEGLVNTAYSKGVCECYAKNFKLICDSVGLETMLATGIGQSGTSSGGHAWNYVKLEDKWYGMDVTWNDTSASMMNKNGKYFLKGSSFASEHHPYDNSSYGISYRVNSPTLSTMPYSIF